MLLLIETNTWTVYRYYPHVTSRSRREERMRKGIILDYYAIIGQELNLSSLKKRL